jgi:hypothetical protein
LNGAIAVLDVFLRGSSNDAAHNRFIAAVIARAGATSPASWLLAWFRSSADSFRPGQVPSAQKK